MTADGGMGDEHLIGQGGDEFIAPRGKFGGDTVRCGGERGQDQQAPGSQGLFPIRWHALGQGAGGANDNGLRAAQEDAQTFLLDW